MLRHIYVFGNGSRKCRAYFGVDYFTAASACNGLRYKNVFADYGRLADKCSAFFNALCICCHLSGRCEGKGHVARNTVLPDILL